MPEFLNDPITPETPVVQPKPDKSQSKQTATAPVTRSGYVDGKYVVADREKHSFHVLVGPEARYDKKTGQETKKSTVQQFSQREWPDVEPNLVRIGLIVYEILHTPVPGSMGPSLTKAK